MEEKKSGSPIKELNLEEKLNFLHETGQEIWDEVLDFESYKKQQEELIPESLTEKYTKFSINISSEKIVEDIIELTFDSLFKEYYGDKFVEVLCDLAFKDKALTKLKNDLNDAIKEDGFNRLSQFFHIGIFMSDFLSRIYQHDKNIVSIFKEDKLILNIPKNKNIIADENTFFCIKDTIKKIIVLELESELERSNIKILNKDGTIYGSLAKKLKTTWVLTDFFRSVEEVITAKLFENKSKSWRTILDESLMSNLFNIKIKQVIESFKNKIQELLSSIGKTQKNIIINFRDDTIEQLLKIPKSNFKLYNLTSNDEQFLIREIQNIFYCLFNKKKVSLGYFLIDCYLDDDIKITEKLLQETLDQTDKLFVKKVFELKKKKLPSILQISGKFNPENYKDSYSVILPSNYIFPKIKNTRELFTAFKITETSIYRYYMSLVQQNYFNYLTFEKMVEYVNKWSKSLLAGIKFSLLGDEYVYTYPLDNIGNVTVTYDLSVYGVINPHVKSISKYVDVIERLFSFKNEIEALTDEIILNYMRAILSVDISKLDNSIIEPIYQALLIQFLADITVCLFLVEGFRNPASFVTHSLVMGKLKKVDTLPNVFPMAPPDSTSIGRVLHSKVSNMTFLGTASTTVKQEDLEELKSREINSLERYQDLTLEKVRENIFSFWENPFEIRNKKTNNNDFQIKQIEQKKN